MPKARSTRDISLADGDIVVSAQQSRFHTEAVDAPTLKDIDIKDLTVGIGGLEILDHAHLKIQDGVHYVFHGRNGTGKSTLLRALAERRIPGVASNLRVLLLGQTRITSDVEAEKTENQAKVPTVLEHVTRSDAKREKLLKESQKLAAVIETKNVSSSGITKVVREVQLEHCEQDLKDARLVAARRSGARGARARQVLIEKEEAVEQAKKKVTDPSILRASDLSWDSDQDLKSGIDMLEAARTALEAMDAGSTEVRARSVLVGLGFTEKRIGQSVNELSGGWQSRCDLACALIQQSDVLLLDEPTNFLDLPAIIWLQRYITETKKGKTVIVVTHDRDFADAVADELLLLRLNPAKTLETFKGDLTEYEAEKRRQIRRMTKMSEAQDKKVKHIEATIQKSVKAAKRIGDDKKLKQAASRQKKLDERTGLEVGLKGGRFKLNRDLGGWHNQNRDAIEIPGFDPPVTLTLPDQPAPLRNPGSLVTFENVSFAYPKSGVWTLKEVNLIIHPGDRIGLAGLNGSGKSTAIKLIMGSAAGVELQPTKGTIATNSQARISCYSQHAVEKLETLGKQESTRTALSHLAAVAGTESNEQDLRSTLAKLGLKGSFVSELPLASLSGGQRVRLALAEALFGSPHLLILDEVTTHLDADTIIALTEVLQEWEGALLVVTHDRYFLRSVVEREKLHVPIDDEDDGSQSDDDDEKPPGTVYRLFKAGLHKLDRGMAQYEELVEKALAKRTV